MAACVGVVALSVAAPAVTAQATVDPGPVLDSTPLTAVINAATARKQTIFSVQVAAQQGDRRFVRSDVVVSGVSMPSGQPNLFLGTSITCTGPSGATVLDVEGGTNVWSTDANFDIPIVGTFTAKTAGTYTCVTQAMICDPGSCTSPASAGTVTLASSSGGSSQGSQLYVSGALPAWATVVQIPKANDVLVNPGRSLTMAKALNLTGVSGTFAMGSFVSLTNCIVKSYPAACNAATKMAVQGSSSVTVTFAIAQRATTPGAKCTTMASSPQRQVITWREHHAVIDIAIPNVTLSTAPGCGSSVVATTTVNVAAGNSVAVEGGTKSVVQSATYALPGALQP